MVHLRRRHWALRTMYEGGRYLVYGGPLIVVSRLGPSLFCLVLLPGIGCHVCRLSGRAFAEGRWNPLRLSSLTVLSALGDVIPLSLVLSSWRFSAGTSGAPLLAAAVDVTRAARLPARVAEG